MDDWTGIIGRCLLFCLVFGMSATVDLRCMTKQIGNYKAILTAISVQFVVLPFFGFLVVRYLGLEYPEGISLLIITTSPGGSYSNWWCSLMNADLALSVATTAVSTLVSVVMLPLNLFIYSQWAFDEDDNALDGLEWGSLFISIGVITGAITLGLIASERENSHYFNVFANKLGNAAGISLVIFSTVLSSSSEEAKIWQKSPSFYIGVALPCIAGLLTSHFIASSLLEKKPEFVTASIESCYQNVGIATSVALVMFDDDDEAQAMGVPLYYGVIEAVVLGIYCFISWKMNWTKAPADDPFCTVISTSYEVLYAERLEYEEIETNKERKEAESKKRKRAESSNHIEILTVGTDDHESPKRFRRFRSTKKVLQSCFPKKLRSCLPRIRWKRGPKEPSRYNLFLPH